MRALVVMLVVGWLANGCRPDPKPAPAPPQTSAAAQTPMAVPTQAVPPEPAKAKALLRAYGTAKPDSAAFLLDSAYRLAPDQMPHLVAQAPPVVLNRWLDLREFRFFLQGRWNYRLGQMQDLDAASFLALRRQLLADPANAKDPDLPLFLHMAGASLADSAQRHAYIRQALLPSPAAAADFATQTAAQLNRTGGNLKEGATALTALFYLAPDDVHRCFWQQTGWLNRPNVAELALLPHQALLLLDDRLPKLNFPLPQRETLHQALIQAQARSRT